ncbi:endonuclease [Vibrio phage PWH3a-P1]|uniref:endonuclease n=1 Tax=Vibrio phage PWH3a-P1 TaxID=754058 RepID=UPI0002C09614|nr:endonuclease [Vibrio phage PWH3a-P1]AGH32046.1 hypothetical protein VPIG_00190 [Vibrio phage PWH3a-P1]
MDSKDNFIGYIFKTDKGSTLIVRGDNGLNGNKKKYILTCSVCSEDEELWPYGSIDSTKSNILKNSTPCGCSNYTRYTDKQKITIISRYLNDNWYNKFKVRKRSLNYKGRFVVECSKCSKDGELYPFGSITINERLYENPHPNCGCAKKHDRYPFQIEVICKRKCKELGYEFRGFVGDTINVNTYLKLYNPLTGNYWETTIIDAFLRGHQDPELTGDRISSSVKKNCKYYADKIYEVLKPKGYKVISNISVDGYNSRFKIECNIGHVYETSVSKIMRGHGCKECCWDKQRTVFHSPEELARSLCMDQGFIYLDIVIGKLNKDSRVSFICENNIQHTKLLKSLKYSSNCTCCSKGNFGYYKDRVDESDTLYIIKSNKGFVKIGRSFDFNRRLSDLEHHFCCTFEVLHIISDKHKHIYNLEQWLHEELYKRGFYFKTEPVSVETFDIDSLEAINFLLRFI